jgi:hypothetical protein
MRDTSNSSKGLTIKHRFSTKLKYQPAIQSKFSLVATTSAIVPISIKKHRIINTDVKEEDALVVCSMDCELHQYLVETSIKLTQIEDVFALN